MNPNPMLETVVSEPQEAYILDGTERIEIKQHQITCGILTETTYFHATTDQMVRRDINVDVDAGFMMDAITGP